MHKKIVLGEEYDDALRTSVSETLKALSAIIIEKWEGLGGSQYVEHMQVLIGARPLVVEAETYMGISIAGDADLVDHVAECIRQRMASAEEQGDSGPK